MNDTLEKIVEHTIERTLEKLLEEKRTLKDKSKRVQGDIDEFRT